MFSRDRPDLTPAQQFMFLRKNPICAGTGRLHATGLIWDYRDSPTPLSREYSLRITFQRGETPSVFVMDPELSACPGERPAERCDRSESRVTVRTGRD